jgi:hypothetical protein
LSTMRHARISTRTAADDLSLSHGSGRPENSGIPVGVDETDQFRRGSAKNHVAVAIGLFP